MQQHNHYPSYASVMHSSQWGTSLNVNQGFNKLSKYYMLTFSENSVIVSPRLARFAQGKGSDDFKSASRFVKHCS